jgi:selenocysteine-specific elongation factor
VQVVATAGHVDHGKSTLVRTLTGMEPDRLAEEQRRGLTIDLGFAWMTLPSGQRLAFVDVPGHGRFVTTMLAGVGPVPAVMFVVAADAGWMPQSAEHLAAVDALGVRHGLLVVTRADLADPAAALAEARAEIGRTSLGTVEAVAVSGLTGEGSDRLVAALDRLAARLPAPDPAAPVRLWLDRAFTIKGSGTVVTGTLPAGRVRVGDTLQLAPTEHRARVRAIESLKEPAQQVAGVARVALNLRGVERAEVARGMALIAPGAWTLTDTIDVRLRGTPASELPHELTFHIGSAAVHARVRPFGDRAARVLLDAPLPLHIGDRGLLRDPGRHVIPAGVTVLDVRPPAIRRRGAGAARAVELASWPERPDADVLVRQHGLLRIADLRAMGCAPTAAPVSGDWLADPDRWAGLGRRLAQAVERRAATTPLDPGVPVEAARHALGLPDRRLVEALVRPPLRLADGRVYGARRGGELPPAVAAAVERLRAELAAAPYRAPDSVRLAELGLGPKALAAAVKAEALLRIAGDVVLLPGADAAAAARLAALPQPFTASEARQALDTSRRVAIPLLEHLDRLGYTERVDETRRRSRQPGQRPTPRVRA